MSGYDGNALYLWSMGESTHYVSEFPQFAAGCRDWIDWPIYECGMKIQSAFHGGEQNIGTYKVDGIYGRSVFEFYGDYWHVHPDKFPNENVHHPSMKHKDGTPMTVKKKIKTIIINVCSIFEIKAITLKLCGRRIGKIF